MEITTIQLDKEIKEKLDLLKVHRRETYNELVSRLISNCSNQFDDTESLSETVEILSDPESMKNIAESLERIEKGNYGISLEKVEQELKNV